MQACSYKNKIDSNYYCQTLKLTCIQSNIVVNFKTTKGDFEVELFGKDNPVTVSNFLENIDNDIYVNQKFYKIINYPQVRLYMVVLIQKINLFLNKNKTSIRQVHQYL